METLREKLGVLLERELSSCTSLASREPVVRAFPTHVVIMYDKVIHFQLVILSRRPLSEDNEHRVTNPSWQINNASKRQLYCSLGLCLLFCLVNV